MEDERVIIMYIYGVIMEYFYGIFINITIKFNFDKLNFFFL